MPQQVTSRWDLFKYERESQKGAVIERIRIVKALGITGTLLSDCSRGRPTGVHKHRHGKTEQKPERDTGSITLKPGTAKNKLFPGYGTNFRYIGEVKNGLDRVTVVTSIPIPKYSDIDIRPIVFNNCTEDLMETWSKDQGIPAI